MGLQKAAHTIENEINAHKAQVVELEQQVFGIAKKPFFAVGIAVATFVVVIGIIGGLKSSCSKNDQVKYDVNWGLTEGQERTYKMEEVSRGSGPTLTVDFNNQERMRQSIEIMAESVLSDPERLTWFAAAMVSVADKDQQYCNKMNGMTIDEVIKYTGVKKSGKTPGEYMGDYRDQQGQQMLQKELIMMQSAPYGYQQLQNARRNQEYQSTQQGKCQKCEGRAMIKCPKCMGTRKITTYGMMAQSSDRNAISCGGCNGAGEILCPVCKSSK